MTPEEKQKLREKLQAAALAIRKYRKTILTVAACLAGALLITGGYLYHRYARELDRRLSAGAFHGVSNIYAAPVVVTSGDLWTVADLKAMLEAAGHTAEADGSRLRSGNAVITIDANRSVSRIEVNGKATSQWNAGAPLIANLSPNREKRRFVTFDEIPQTLLRAVMAIEDKRFFRHRGIDLERMVKAGLVDIRSGRKEQGASTLTMQLVRGLWLDSDKSWKRKVAETMMTMHLEHKWPKEQIFEAYANQVFLGREGSYSIHGFAEGARVFFNKDIEDLNLPEAATLAGMVQRPSYYNPVRYPERTTKRRDLVLQMMLHNKYISQEEYRDGMVMPLGIENHPERDDTSGVSYGMDLVNIDPNRTRDVYTTIDLNLQRAASEAIAAGMREVDQRLAKRYAAGGPHAEAALIAIDPHTGEIKAMVGGRDYSHSQLNRVLANRPPGSVFKPFVYATAIDTAVRGGEPVLTAASTVDDSPITIGSGKNVYQPANFRNESFGTLTLRQALAHSDNIAAVKVGQMVGFSRVVGMARHAGLNDKIRATPSVALGSYAVTPFEMAGAYTAFANGGVWVKPHLIAGDGVQNHQAMDPRVAAVMVNMLQEVLRSGTGAGVRSRGFALPAAGKTGTSHDGWFAGFTTKLLCVVWVGFDDYSELNLEGAKSALPIWTAFMKKAASWTPYREAGEFGQVDGVERASICTETGKLAGEFCTSIRDEVFIAGTVPAEKCDKHTIAPITVQANITTVSSAPETARTDWMQ